MASGDIKLDELNIAHRVLAQFVDTHAGSEKADNLTKSLQVIEERMRVLGWNPSPTFVPPTIISKVKVS